jgi:hypothetical protein
MPKIPVSAEERRERRCLRSVRRYEKMLVLMDKPGAERIFPDVEAVKPRFRERLEVARDPEAHRREYRGSCGAGVGFKNEGIPHEPAAKL